MSALFAEAALVAEAAVIASKAAENARPIEEDADERRSAMGSSFLRHSSRLRRGREPCTCSNRWAFSSAAMGPRGFQPH
jgi:hypothetical protein